MNKHRILIVDDEAAVTRLLKLNLEATGRYEVREENQPAATLTTARLFRPDLILLDVMMPELDGGEVFARLQEHTELRRIPVVFLTAAVKKKEVGQSGGIIGGHTYLAKPVDLDDVLACLERQLARPPV